MLLAVAALLFQFPVLSAYHLPDPATGSEAAAVSKAADDAKVAPAENDAPGDTAVRGDAASANADSATAPVSLEPGRLVATPITTASASPTPVAGPAFPAVQPAAIRPVYGPPIRAVSDPWQKRKWLALSIAAHGAAGFDAWSTRKVLSSVPGAEEMNPLLRPFAGNASMYAAVQVAPTLFDFLARRMMNSRHEILRNTWWLPQAVSAVVSVASGVHNIGVYNSR